MYQAGLPCLIGHMNFFKRATTSISRQLGKTIILLLLVFILGTVISGAISAVTAINNTNTNLRRQMRPLASLEIDYDTIMEEIHVTEYFTTTQLREGFEYPLPIMPEQIREIASLPQVEHFTYSIHSLVQLFGVTEHQVREGGQWNGVINNCAFNRMTDRCVPETLAPIFQTVIRGVSSEKPMTMHEGLIELVEGNSFENYHLNMQTDAYPIMISRGFASENGWELGSIITLEQRWWLPGEMIGEIVSAGEFTIDDLIFATQSFEFEIIGLFDVPLNEELFEQNEIYEMQRIQYLINHIYTTNEAADAHVMVAREIFAEYLLLEGSEYWDDGHTIDEILIILYDPLQLEDFRTAAMPYLPENWTVVDFTDSFAAIEPSMNMLNEIADQILVGVALASVLILSLLITLFLKDRRHELGIYLALGEKKAKIVMQTLFEVVAISLIGITLAIFAGNLIAGRLSQEMVLTELTAEVPSLPDRWGSGREHWDMGLAELGFAPELTPDELISAFDATLTGNTIILIYGAGIATVMISTLIPVIYIVKLNPKKVLL